MKLATHLVAAAALLLAPAIRADEQIIKLPGRDDVVGVDGDDGEMLEAQKKAQDSLMQFIRAIQKRAEGERYLLKVRLTEGDVVEHVWLKPVKWNDPGLIGILAVDPVTIKKMKKGDIVAPLPREITDWVILSKDGTRQGGFTEDVIERQESRDK